MNEKELSASLAAGQPLASPSQSAAATARHTAGPWSVDHSRDLSVVKKNATICLVTGGLDDVFEHGLYGPVSEANAHLIAAAPEMKTALTALKAFWGVTLEDPAFRTLYNPSYLRAIQASYEQAETALAKAEGRS